MRRGSDGDNCGALNRWVWDSSCWTPLRGPVRLDGRSPGGKAAKMVERNGFWYKCLYPTNFLDEEQRRNGRTLLSGFPEGIWFFELQAPWSESVGSRNVRKGEQLDNTEFEGYLSWWESRDAYRTQDRRAVSASMICLRTISLLDVCPPYNQGIGNSVSHVWGLYQIIRDSKQWTYPGRSNKVY